MDIIQALNEKYIKLEWELDEFSDNQFRILCNGKETIYTFYDFEKMFIPGMDESEKERMTRENIEGIIHKIKEEGISFLKEVSNGE